MKIFLALPNLGEIATGNVWNLLQWQSDPTLDVELYMPEGLVPGEKARNACHKAFIESDCDVMFCLDERTVPQPWFLDKLIGHIQDGKQFVSACVQTLKTGKGGEPYLAPLGVRWNEELGGYSPCFSAALTELHASSISCALITREVMESVERPAFETKFLSEYGDEVVTSDFAFCEKVRAAGYQIWIDYDLLCRHYQRLETKNFNTMLHRVVREARGE